MSTKYRWRRPAIALLAVCAVAVPVLVSQTSAASTETPPLVVGTDSGQVRGVDTGKALTFSGIRYAAPPVGPLRWKDPQPPQPWDGVADASKPGSPCAQQGMPGSEDCLFVNVTTPREHDGGPLPVMVWLHGGGFTTGDGASYDAQRMADQGDVMVVTANYRLGVFGYFGHPGLAGSGDFGMADQLAALRWTERNAAAFGGDTGNVTLFGQSAGSMSTCGLLTSPASAGLFDKAIMSSGSCMQDWPDGGMVPNEPAQAPYAPLAKTEADGKALAAELKCTDVDCLRELPADALVPHMQAFKNHLTYNTPLLPQDPAKALRSGAFHRVPVITGTTHDETRPLITGVINHSGPITPERYAELLRTSYGDQADEVAARYPVTDFASPAEAWATVTTDRSWSCPAYTGDRLLARHTPVHAYEYNDQNSPPISGPELPELPMGAGHAHDLPSLFDLLGQPWPFTPEQQRLADQMVRYWTAFAHDSDPNTAGAPYWPEFDDGGPVLTLAPDAIGASDFAAEHQCGFWRGLSR